MTSDRILRDFGTLAGRSPAELTRRDVVRGLLSVPARTATAALPELRRGLVAADNPVSAPFWDAAELMLVEIAEGRATVGAVRRWLQASGTEPIDLVAGGFVWPADGERGPVATELHAALVAHLERLVAGGAIDPDRLVAGDATAWAAYEQRQVEWLRTPLPDGREPMWAVSDEQDEEFLADWDAADTDARAILADLLVEAAPRPRPDADLRIACERLREGLRGGDRPYDVLRAAGGVDPGALPADDVELWLALGAGVVACRDEPPSDLDDGVHAAWIALTHADWIAAVVTLIRGGAGTAADAASLATYAAGFDFEELDGLDGLDDEVEDWDVDEDVDAAVAVLTAGFSIVEQLWSVLGALDSDACLTPLGRWGLPETLTRAWSPSD